MISFTEFEFRLIGIIILLITVIIILLVINFKSVKDIKVIVPADKLRAGNWDACFYTDGVIRLYFYKDNLYLEQGDGQVPYSCTIRPPIPKT